MSADSLHFIALTGSLRQKSFSRAIAVTLDELAPDDVAVEVLGTLADIPLFDQDLHERSVPPAVAQAAAAIAAADAVVIVTPEYNHSIPGGLKNALDWLSRLPDRPFGQKPTAIQSSSPGLLGGVRAQGHVRAVLVAMDAIVLNRPEVVIAQVGDKVDAATGTVREEATRRHLAEQLRALAGLVRSRRQTL